MESNDDGWRRRELLTASPGKPRLWMPSTTPSADSKGSTSKGASVDRLLPVEHDSLPTLKSDA